MKNAFILTFAFLGLAGVAQADLVPADPDTVSKWCKEIEQGIKQWKWGESPCRVKNWKIGGVSVENRPLMYAEFGDPNSVNSTLVLAMVHGDEVTPLFIALRMAEWLQNNQDYFAHEHIVVAPLVNPDGFFKRPQTRMNARGVDVNRNFSTSDWKGSALQAWKTKFRSDPRRFPGNSAESEPETLFQTALIRQTKPQKIISIHAPLNFLDYDGPNTLSLARFPKDYVKQCLALRQRLRAISSGFFPGSLGNWAGQEQGIPTFTLELPTANPKMGMEYWRKFKPGIKTVIQYKVADTVVRPTSTP